MSTSLSSCLFHEEKSGAFIARKSEIHSAHSLLRNRFVSLYCVYGTPTLRMMLSMFSISLRDFARMAKSLNVTFLSTES